MKLRTAVAILLGGAGVSVVAPPEVIGAQRRAVTPATPPSQSGRRILLVDDDRSDNNNNPADSRRTPSDLIYHQLVVDALGRDSSAMAIERVRPYGNGPDLERLRTFDVIVWYTGSNYGGNADNAAVLSIVDEKTVRRYLEETGGTVILVSPGYVSKVLGANSTWEKASWPFLNEVLGIKGGKGLAQRFQPGTVVTPDGTKFTVGKGAPAVESQFSAVNPDGATVVFTAALYARDIGDQPVPVATVANFGRGRIVYVGFTFENLATADLTPAFRYLLSLAGPSSIATVATVPPPRVTALPPAPGSAPVTVQVTGTPTSAFVSWTIPTAPIVNATPGTTTATARGKAPAPTSPVTVERLVANAPSVRLRQASPEAFSAVDPGPLTPGRAVTYRVTITNTRGVAEATEATYTPPLPQDPAGLTGTVGTDARVVLNWQAVPGAAGYQVSSTALATPVVVRGATSWRSAPQGGGLREWRVATVYEPRGVMTAQQGWPSVQTRFVPTPGAAFLSLPLGDRGLTQSDMHYTNQCRSIMVVDCRAENLLLVSGGWQRAWSSRNIADLAPYPSVAFADVKDLGRGRRVGCSRDITTAGQKAGQKHIGYICWALSHGPVPAPGVTVNGVALAQTAEQFNDPSNVSLSTIVITDEGAIFGQWVPPSQPWPANPESRGPAFGGRKLYPLPKSGSEYEYDMFTWDTDPGNAKPAWLLAGTWDPATLGTWQREALLAAVARPAPTMSFDSEGPKAVPQACLSCHGGRYDPLTGYVVGASLLPLIPSELVFSSPDVRSRVRPPAVFTPNSEWAVRLINEIICLSNPSPTIRERIQGLYPGSAGCFSKAIGANDDAVPPGWSTQAGLYRKVVAPYCGSCHFAQTGPLSFRTWGNMLQVKDAVQRTVCRQFTMPHSEIAYRKFWTEGGAVSLPGLLSTTLGFQKCPE